MQITVQKIWPLDPTKNSGGFKGTDGVNYYCEIGAYHLVREGMTFEANPRPYTSKSGKSSFIMPKDWHPPATIAGGQAAPPPAPGSPPPRPAANGSAPAAYVPEQEKQGYIMVSVMMKLLADAQTQAGKPVDTQDLPLLADAAVACWRDHLKGKV